MNPPRFRSDAKHHLPLLAKRGSDRRALGAPHYRWISRIAGDELADSRHIGDVPVPPKEFDCFGRRRGDWEHRLEAARALDLDP
jgi:hypothetical protein